MKIEYTMKDSYIKDHNKAYGIYLLRKKLKKNPKTKIRSYTSLITRIFSLSIIVTFIVAITCFNAGQLNLFNSIVEFACILIIIYVDLILLFFMILKNNSNNKKGTFEINENGIVDTSENNIGLVVPYDQIEIIVVTNNLITIFIKNFPMMILVNLDDDKIINKIKKYSDVQIVINKKK